MQLLQYAWGFDPWDALLGLELVDLDVDDADRVWSLHPGAGTVAQILGLEAARACPGVRRVALKVGVGDPIAERQGSGMDVCAVYAEGSSRDAVAASLSSAVEAIHFELR